MPWNSQVLVNEVVKHNIEDETEESNKVLLGR